MCCWSRLPMEWQSVGRGFWIGETAGCILGKCERWRLIWGDRWACFACIYAGGPDSRDSLALPTCGTRCGGTLLCEGAAPWFGVAPRLRLGGGWRLNNLLGLEASLDIAGHSVRLAVQIPGNLPIRKAQSLQQNCEQASSRRRAITIDNLVTCSLDIGIVDL